MYFYSYQNIIDARRQAGEPDIQVPEQPEPSEPKEPALDDAVMERLYDGPTFHLRLAGDIALRLEGGIPKYFCSVYTCSKKNTMKVFITYISNLI